MSAARPRVAWVHGYTMDSRVWEPLWSELPSFDHVGVDLPGHGTRSREPMPRTLTGWAEVVLSAMTDAGADRLVGLSFGSSIALQAAATRPDVVRRLVLAAPTLSGAQDDPAARAKYFLLASSLGELGPGPALARIWMNDPPPIFAGLRAHPEAYERMQSVVAEHSFAELRTGAMGSLSATVQDAALLHRVGCPTLVLSGDDDMPRFRENACLIDRSVPTSRMVVLPGLGHLPLLEDPARCTAELEDFLSGQP